MGAIWPARWQFWHLAWRMGAMSLAKVRVWPPLSSAASSQAGRAKNMAATNCFRGVGILKWAPWRISRPFFAVEASKRPMASDYVAPDGAKQGVADFVVAVQR